MQALIDRVSTAANIEPETAQKAIATILNFLQKEGPPEEVEKVMAALPGAREAAAGAAVDESASGGGSGGFFGGGGGGLMGLAGQLTSIGLGMGEMQTVGKEVFAYAREHVGEDTVGAIAGAIPGMHQIV